ncbi:MAG: coproporphyrinogen-III oxidase family protein [Verrucomicrobiia bacterium]|jgi:oxygen-independent coproporphyrinogen-3 oxidase
MSTATSTPTPKPALETQTTAGNYFVSNYPPFSFWKPEGVPGLMEAIERPPEPDTPLGIYVHIPFCRKRCHFCYFKVYTDKDSSEIRAYTDAVRRELEIYASKPFIGGRKPNFIYFGGGTPSYLSVNQLKELTDAMKEVLPWDEAEEVAFEAEPGTLTDHKLAAIRELGVTRLSLGVENLDDHILEINGRAHRSKEIKRAYNFAREVGFDHINVDLIAGMLEETDPNWKDVIRQTIDLAPDCITIYEMEIPYNTTIYQRMKTEGKLIAPVADWETKRRWVDYAYKELEKAGYTITSAYTAVKDPEKTKFIYRDRLWEGADLLSVGVASFGHIGGTHYQNHHEFDPYVERVNHGELPIFRALTPSDDERLIREFILQMKLGHLSLGYFTKKFGVDPEKRFAEPLQRLKDWGFLAIKGDRLEISREGLLQVDKLLHEFFLPEHLNKRYA